MRLGPLEIGLILVIILIVFGAGKLPEVGKALGQGIRNFRRAQSGDYDESKPPAKQIAAEATVEKPEEAKK